MAPAFDLGAGRFETSGRAGGASNCGSFGNPVRAGSGGGASAGSGGQGSASAAKAESGQEGFVFITTGDPLTLF